MNASPIAGFVVAWMAGTTFLEVQEKPVCPTPERQHQWLQQLSGEWESEFEGVMEPGKPPQKSKGAQSIRNVGGFWIVSEITGTCGDKPFTGLLTLGYDQDQKKFVGTWVDTMSSYLWKYEGTLDPARNALTLETEGPCPMAPGKRSRFKEVIEIKGKDQQVFTASVKGEDGNWVTMMNCTSRRKR